MSPCARPGRLSRGVPQKCSLLSVAPLSMWVKAAEIRSCYMLRNIACCLTLSCAVHWAPAIQGIGCILSEALLRRLTLHCGTTSAHFPVALETQEDVFTLNLPELGAIRSLSLRTDGKSEKPSWCPDWAVVEPGEQTWKGQKQQVPDALKAPPAFFVAGPDGWIGPSPVRCSSWSGAGCWAGFVHGMPKPFDCVAVCSTRWHHS
eukprot:scaffold103715_cov17-Tisochrysis_lutea.AAC.1